MKNQKGFSLVELLVVVIILAIIAAIAIPSLLASRRAANEAAAVTSLRTLHSSQAAYQAIHLQTYSPTLTALGPAGDALIDGALAAGTKNNYTFALTTNSAATPANTLYCATAIPAAGSGGVRRYAVDNTGGIYQSAADGTSAPTCAAGAMTLNGATAIQ
jgi:type IV pilus assembly protein PilA